MTITNATRPTRALHRHDGVENEPSRPSAIFPDTGNGASSVGWVPPEDALQADTVPPQVKWFDGRIRTVQIVVNDLNELTEEICLDGNTIGFISRVGRIFVAQTGTRLDRAEECGQCFLWDEAATILVALSTRITPLEEPDPQAVQALERTTDTSDGNPDQAMNSQNLCIHEMSGPGGHKW